MMNRIKGMAIVGLIGGLSACSSVKVTSWSDPAFANRAVGKVMILGVGESTATSRQYELHFVDELVPKGVEAISCHALLKPADGFTEERLVSELESRGFDSIIVTRLVAEKDRTQYVAGGTYGDGYYGYYSYGRANMGYSDSYMEYQLETNLYDVKTRTLVWSGQKSVYDTKTEQNNIKAVVKAVIKDLQQKNLL